MSSLTAWMRVRMRRRSVSSLVSPGPRVPMPPPSRDSAVAGADEPRQQVLQLRELDLQLAFARPRAAREDVEDQLRAIDDLAADLLFDLAQLRRRQLVVEDDDVDARLGARRGERLDLAGAEKRRRDPASAAPAARAARPRRRPPRQAGELVERALGVEPPRAPGDQADERRALARGYALRAEACLNLVPMQSRRRARAGLVAGDVDDRRRRPAGRRPGVEQQIDPLAERPLDVVRDRPSPAAPLEVRAGRRERPAARAAQIARATACAGTRTPTVPRAAGHSRRAAPAARQQQRQRPRPERVRERRADRRQRARAAPRPARCRRRQRQRALGRASLDGEDARDRRGAKTDRRRGRTACRSASRRCRRALDRRPPLPASDVSVRRGGRR